MSSIKRLVVLVIIAIAIVCLLSSVKGEDIQEQEHLCNQKDIANDRQQGRVISNLVAYLVVETSMEGNSLQGNSLQVDLNGYYAAAACNGQISMAECYDCLEMAQKAISKSCRFADGWQIKLIDCRLRVEHYKFTDW